MINFRQERLYKFLLEQGDVWTPEKEVCDKLFVEYPDVVASSFNNSAARRRLSRDIQEINESDEVEKIIITSSYGVKIATKEESEHYLTRQFASIMKELKRYYQKCKKAGMDGQYKYDQKIISAFLED